MSRYEPQNAITFHPDVNCSILLFQHADKTSDAEPIHVVGKTIEGILKLVTVNQDELFIGKIEVEYVAVEAAQTRHDAMKKILWTHVVPFQGPSLPLSNAVYQNRDQSLPRGYHPARKGITSFPIRITLPSNLPGTLTSPSASISHTLQARVEVLKRSNRYVLCTSTTVDVVSCPPSFPEFLLESVKAEADLNVRGARGKLKLELSDAGLGAWGVGGQPFWVHVRVKDPSQLVFRLRRLQLVRKVHVDFEGQLKVLETVEAEKDVFATTSSTTMPYDGQWYSDIALPCSARSISAPGRSSIKVTYEINIVAQGDHDQNATNATIPVEIFHPVSLPPDLLLAHEAHLNEMRFRSTLESPPIATRRWSTPSENLGHFAPARHLPHPLPGTTSLVGQRPFSHQSYIQPEWVVHDLTSVSEEPKESKAERTSRHLRETSGHRGRSVSPPLIPALVTSPPRLQRPPSVVGPRPAPSQSMSTPRANLLSEPATSGQSQPPLLSPIPVQIEPSSYFDQAVHQLSEDSALETTKLSPATVISLQNIAEHLDFSPKAGSAISLESVNGPAHLRPAGSPVRERRSVLDVFSAHRPEARRRESNERKVEVEMRHHREASHAAEVYEQPEDRHTMDIDHMAPNLGGNGSRMSDSTQVSDGSSPQMRSPSGSIRGRGGQVTAVKELFQAIERHASISGEDKRIRRKSVPAVTGSMLLNSEAVQKVKRLSLAGEAMNTDGKASPASTSRPPVFRMESETPVLVKQFAAPPPLKWDGPRDARKAFEEVDIKEGKMAKKRGPVGRLKALIERFERW